MTDEAGDSFSDPTQNIDIHDALANKVELWRDKLLDLGNRNALINTKFSDYGGTIEFDTPVTEEIWVKLAAESEAGANPMRFPWHRDLVPPPEDWQEFDDELDGEANDTQTLMKQPEGQTSTPVQGSLLDPDATPTGEKAPGDQPAEETGKENKTSSELQTIRKRKRREWNPPLEECRRSQYLQPLDLLVDVTDKALDRKLRNLESHARLAMSEQGVHVIYVAFGFLKWYESTDSNEERYSPLMLVPVTLSRDSTSDPWELTEAEDDAIDNLCLRQRLWQDFKLELPPLPEINELEEDGARESFLNKVSEAIEKHERWEVVDKCVLGRFAFPKIAMWKDLGDHKKSVTEHNLCRALGGDESAIGAASFGPVHEVPTAKELDDVISPGDVKAILDCDSSQFEAIVAARKGVSFVLDGPPGTGKSQTIANIIADALAVGRTVLFVSEKISALEVVKHRLEARQLDDFCLECHSDKANRRAVLFELERCLDLPAEVYQDIAPKLDELADQRSRLNEYVRRIHEPRDPLGLSAYELFGRVSRLTNRGLAQLTRCKLPSLAEIDRKTFDSWMRLLGKASDVNAVIIEHDKHPWRGCKQTVRSLSIHDDIKHHFGILSEHLQRISRLFEPIVGQNLTEPITPANLNEILKSCTQALTVPHVPLAWFNAPKETATAIVSLLSAEALRSNILNELDRFVENVEETFPVEAAREIVTNTEAQASEDLGGFSMPSSPNVRERLSETVQQIERLRGVADSLDKLDIALTEHFAATKLEVSENLNVEQLGHLGKATHSAALAGPARSQWLNSNSVDSVRSLADKALKFVGKNEEVVDQLSSLVSAEQVPALAETLLEAGESQVVVAETRKLGLTDRSSVDDALSGITEAEKLIQEIKTVVSQIGEEFGSNASQMTSVRLTARFEDLYEILKRVEEVGYFCGSWRDPSVRDPLRRASEDAINDLTEAESIRESLSDRFSHRAFRESASSLATRGTMYASLFKRWFGGFGAYRAEIAELYSGEVPKGSAVVEDMAMLQKYHRRLSGVQEEADELKPHLPEDFVVYERTSWERLKEALKAFDQLAIAWPELVVSLPNGRHHILHGKLTDPARRLLQASQDYEQLVNKTKFELPMLGNEDLTSIQQALDDNSMTLASCRELWEKCEELTVRSMLSLTEFDQLITTMSKFSRRQNELNAASEKYAIWLPENSTPTSSSTWQALLNGLEASEQFAISGIDLNKLEEAWCKGAFRLQKDNWSKAGRRLDEASVSTQHALQSTGLDSSGFVFKDLVHSIRSTITKLLTQQKHLEAVVSTLRDEENVAVLELADFSDQVADLRETAPVIEKERSKLIELGIHDVSAEQLDAAKWLSQAASDGELNPLSQSIASEETTRAQVRDALHDAKSTFNGNEFEESWCFLKTLFDLDTAVSKGFIISETTLGDLADNLAWLITQMSHFDEWLKFASWKLDAQQAGFGTVVDELVAKRYEPQDTADVVAVQFYRQLFDKLAEVDRTLGNFDVDEHERIRERFRFLDQWEVKASSTRIRQYQLGREDRPSSSFLGADSSELGILQKEISKKRKHKPLRRLFAEIPTVLQRLKPCVMMSPLSVSTFLNTDSIRFDLVIFDEASQVFPWDALGAIYRGQQLIVAGDDKQLPPTNFFNRADAESEDDEEDIGDYESILSLCKSIGMPNQRLKWHYRSRREPLIAFSNRHFYDGELVTFPSVYDARGDGVRFEHVSDGRWIDRKNLKEAERVVEMIVNHVQRKPDKSLGIIAFNQSQQRAIEDTLYDLRRERPDVDALFDSGDYFGNVDERLFIKNLENVQGDERDIIILSMGYGFNDAGKFIKNFGPINRPNGERRLNVAVTRAREELILVSSVRAADMDLTASKSEGAHLLKAYLNYAEKGVDTLGVAMNEFAGEIESPFEEEVAASLIQRGLEPVPQVGCGGFRIDLALKHPERPGEFCLGVECDGATYHSSNTARDRDRIRQSVLENLGWRIVRIWSTDWIRDPDRQINRVMDEYHAAVTMSPPSYLPFAEDDEEDEFQPEYIETASTSKPPAHSFGSIDEVPDAVIQSTATYVLTQAGAMAFDDLIKQTSRGLGFRRVGGRIKTRLEKQFKKDLETGQLKRLGERVTTGEQNT